MRILRRSTHFDGSRAAARPLARIDNLREAAKDFRRELLARPPVRYYRSMELVRVPYPARFAYLNAYTGRSGYVHLVNRLFVVQFDSAEGLKTLLVSPMDWEQQRETPFFKRLTESYGPLAAVGESLVFKKTRTVLQALAEIGLAPEDIDYLSYDHLHTVNLRRWLGADGAPAVFPNAKLLVMREEWESAQALIPWQNQWYCPAGIAGVPADKLILLDHDVFLGEGVALVRTKGHTEGNHSIVVNAGGTLYVTSENGVSLDAWSPRRSRIPGLAEYARVTGAEVILNGNTLEYAVDQYLSMIQEREIAGPSERFDGYYNLAASSESDGYWLFPGTRPSQVLGELCFGELQRPLRQAA
jgi:glyoxylase-like metal-dependent hydrolase (beta-lactamase superfamily II)